MTTAPIPGPPRDLVGYAGQPPKVHWPGDARVAVSLVVNYEEGSEQAVADGDPDNERFLADMVGYPSEPGVRDLAMESMYEYGTRAGVWRLLDVLDEFDVPATFYACAVALERTPQAAAQLRPRGHDVVSHGYRWEDVARLGRDEERRHIALAVESITRTTGARPTGWYCRYGPSVHTRELLVEEGGFTYDCDAYNDDLPYWTQIGERRHLVIPYTLAANDTGFAGGQFGSPRDFEEYLCYHLDRLYEEGATVPKLMSVGLHQRIVGQPARAQGLARFLDYAQSRPGVWFARRGDIAEVWAHQFG